MPLSMVCTFLFLWSTFGFYPRRCEWYEDFGFCYIPPKSIRVFLFFFFFKSVHSVGWTGTGNFSAMGSSWKLCLVLLPLLATWSLPFMWVLWWLARYFGSVYDTIWGYSSLVLSFEAFSFSPAAVFALTFFLLDKKVYRFFKIWIFASWRGMDWGLPKVASGRFTPLLNAPLWNLLPSFSWLLSSAFR